MNSLFNHPKLYHAQYLDLTKDLRHYRDLAVQSKGPVLELAIGTGRVSKGILEKGISLVGIDPSQEMLNHAAEYLREFSGILTLKRASFSNFELNEQFTLIICTFNSLQHIDNIQDLVSSLKIIHRHLKPDGVFAFDLIHPQADQLAHHQDPTLRERFFDETHNCSCEVWETAAFDGASKCKTHHWRYRWQNGKESVQTVTQRFFSTEELYSSLLKSGFSIQSHFGDFQKTPFNPLSRKHVFVCGRAIDKANQV